MYRGNRTKVDRVSILKAFVKRKNDIMRPNMTLLPISSPGWSLLAADLGNRYVPGSLRNMVYRQPEIATALLIDSPIIATPPKDNRLKPLYLIGATQAKNNANRSTNNARSRYERHNINSKIPTRSAQLVLPEGYPTLQKVSKENSVPSPSTVTLEDDKSLIEIHHIDKEAEIRLQRMKIDMTHTSKLPKKVSGTRPRVERNILINEILKRKDEIITSTGKYITATNPVWKEIVNATGNVLRPFTIWDFARKHDILNIGNNRKLKSVRKSKTSRVLRASTKQSMINNKSPRRSIIQCDTMMNILLKYRNEILSADGRYVPSNNPVWTKIADELGNKIPILAVYKIAHRPEIRERMIADDKKNLTINVADEVQQKRRSIEPKNIIDAILARRSEIVNHEGRYVSVTNPAWCRIANDLNNMITPLTVYDMAMRDEVREIVLLKDDKENIDTSVPIEQETINVSGTGDIRNEINEMVFEEALPKLLKTIDSTNALTKEMKELRRIVRDEILGLKNDIRDKIQEFKRDIRDEIREIKKEIREDIKELMKDIREREKHYGVEHLPIHLD